MVTLTTLKVSKNVGNNLTEVAKKLGETTSKKIHNLAK